MDKLKQVIGLGSPEPPAEPSMPSFSLKESPEGRLRFTTFATNNFEDQLGEIFPEEAHEEFIAWAYENKGFPELWPWHMYGERLGVVDTMAYTNGFLISSGLIDEGMEVKAKSWADDPNTAMSHGFFKRQVGSDIVRYREFEQSVLPRWAACNPWTDFTVGAKEMALTDEKRREFAEKGYTPEEITALDTMTAGFRDKLKAAGVAFKDITDEDSAPAGETPPTAQPETPPAPAAPAAPTGGLTLEDIRAAIRDELAANTEIAALKEQIAGFKGGADDYFANLWKSRGAQPQVPASKSESNIVSGKESEAAKNPAAWINDVPLFEHPIFRNGRVG